MIGWHYTSYDNWLNIRINGLKTYHIDKENLRKYYYNGVKGIWVWVKPQMDIGHAGCIILQAANKASTKIVLLEVNYFPSSRLTHNGSLLLLNHDGNINNLIFHDGSEKAVIVQKKIKPKKIKLLEIYDLTKTFKEHL